MAPVSTCIIGGGVACTFSISNNQSFAVAHYQRNRGIRFRDRSLHDLLKLDPYKREDRLKYNDAAVLRKLNEDPAAAETKYWFVVNERKWKHYPLMMLCSLKASKEAIELTFNACESAIRETDLAGWTPLHIACSNQSSTEVIRFLALKAGKEGTMAKSRNDLWAPLHLLCRYGATLDKVKALVEINPLCVVAATSNGSTALHLAILYDAPTEVIQYLVQTNGMTTLLQTTDGRTPIDYAKRKRLHQNIIKDMKRASDAARCIKRPETRVELDSVISDLEETSRVARKDGNADMTILQNGIDAEQQLTWLSTFQDTMASQEELESSIEELTAKRDSLRDSGDLQEAIQVQTSIEELSTKLKREIEARRRMDAPKDIEHSRQILLQKLSSTTASPAAPISLTFIEQATENFSRKNLIGRGGFGEVFRGTDVKSGVSFAVKRILPSVLFGDHDGRVHERLKAEIEGMSKLWHHNIARLLGTHITNNNSEPQCLIYELAAGGSLADVLSTKEGREALTWRKRVRTAFALVSAELYLCSKKCYHRDIKPQNVCYWPDLEKVILIDYGIAEFMDSESFQSTVTASRFAGSRPYAAPEYLVENHFGEKSEVYSIGCVLKVLITGKLAGAKHLVDDDVAGAQMTDPLDVDHVDTMAGDWDPSILDSIKSLALICTLPDRNDRPTMQQLFNELDDIESRSQRVLSAQEQTSINSALSMSRTRTADSVSLAPLQVMQCLYCNRRSEVGLMCPATREAHFSCKRCFMEHVMENLGDEHIGCRSEGCCSPPYSLEQIYSNVSNSMFSKHWELQQKNTQYAQQVKREEAFVDKIVQAVGNKIDESRRSTMRCLEMVGQNELKCPKLCLVVPARSERGSSSILRTIRTLPESGKVQILLYFVCASERVPVDIPIRLSIPKQWLKQVAFAVKATLIVLKISTTIAGIPVPIPVPGSSNFNEAIRCLDELFSEFITDEANELLQSVMRDSSGGHVSSETAQRLDKLRNQIHELSHDSYSQIAKVAEENAEWRECMELCANKSGVVAWVLKRNASTWRKSS